MLKVGSYAYCIDITGVYLVKIFKALGAGSRNNIILGTMVMIVVKSVNVYLNLFIYFFNNCIYYMKLNSYFRKTSIKKRNNYLEYRLNRNNRSYSRQEQFSKKGKNDILDYIEKQNKIKKDLPKIISQVDVMLDHPNIVDVIDVYGEKSKVAITNITTKNKQVLIDGRWVDVEYIGKINGKHQYAVKAILEVKMDTKNLVDGTSLEKNSKFNFIEEDKEKFVMKSREVINNNDVIVFNGKKGSSQIGKYKITNNQEDIMDRFDN